MSEQSVGRLSYRLPCLSLSAHPTWCPWPNIRYFNYLYTEDGSSLSDIASHTRTSCSKQHVAGDSSSSYTATRSPCVVGLGCHFKVRQGSTDPPKSLPTPVLNSQCTGAEITYTKFFQMATARQTTPDLKSAQMYSQYIRNVWICESICQFIDIFGVRQ